MQKIPHQYLVFVIKDYIINPSFLWSISPLCESLTWMLLQLNHCSSSVLLCAALYWIWECLHYLS